MSATIYYIYQDGQQKGPLELEQLKADWAAGKVNGQVLYWKEGLDGWKPLEEIKSLLIPEPPKPVAPPPPPAPPAPPPDPEADKPQFYTFHNGQQTGPHSINQLRSQKSAGQINDTTYFWKEGMPGWAPLAELADKLKPAAPVATTTVTTSTTTAAAAVYETTSVTSATTVNEVKQVANSAIEITNGPFQDFVDRDKQSLGGIPAASKPVGPFFEVLLDGVNSVRFSLEELQGGWRAGAIKPEMNFREEGQSSWSQLGTIAGQLD